MKEKTREILFLIKSLIVMAGMVIYFLVFAPLVLFDLIMIIVNGHYEFTKKLWTVCNNKATPAETTIDLFKEFGVFMGVPAMLLQKITNDIL